jgi:hypothetical protein
LPVHGYRCVWRDVEPDQFPVTRHQRLSAHVVELAVEDCSLVSGRSVDARERRHVAIWTREHRFGIVEGRAAPPSLDNQREASRRHRSLAEIGAH